MIRNKMKSDRSGVGTILIAVIVIVVVAVAAGGLYYALVYNNDNNNDSEPVDLTEKELAPGSTFTYDLTVDGTTISLTDLYIGQNAESYFVKETFSTEDTLVIQYGLSPRSPSDIHDTGSTATISTMDGQKTLHIWEYTEDSATCTAYVDTVSGIIYRTEATDGTLTQTYNLTAYTLR